MNCVHATLKSAAVSCLVVWSRIYD